MESAPKDGSRILVYGRSQERATSDWISPEQAHIVQWETDTTYGEKSGCWANTDGYYEIYVEALAWLPIPEPPSAI